MRQKTFVAKEDDIERRWWAIDARGIPLGRLATRLATLLRGKHKPIYTPHVDCGDYVIVINAAELVLTGRKAEQKFHYRHSGRPGSLKKVSYGQLLAERPRRLVELAVKGMLPKTRLGRRMIRKLKVYDGAEHPHEAQQPEPYVIDE